MNNQQYCWHCILLLLAARASAKATLSRFYWMDAAQCGKASGNDAGSMQPPLVISLHCLQLLVLDAWISFSACS
jgi:hypothetical protein